MLSSLAAQLSRKKGELWGLPGGSAVKESTRQCSGQECNPWSGMIPQVAEQPSPWATTAEPVPEGPGPETSTATAMRGPRSDHSNPRLPQREEARSNGDPARPKINEMFKKSKSPHAQQRGLSQSCLSETSQTHEGPGLVLPCTQSSRMCSSQRRQQRPEQCVPGGGLEAGTTRGARGGTEVPASVLDVVTPVSVRVSAFLPCVLLRLSDAGPSRPCVTRDWSPAYESCLEGLCVQFLERVFKGGKQLSLPLFCWLAGT